MKILNDVQKIFNENTFEQIVLPEGYSNVYWYLSHFPDEKNVLIPNTMILV